MTDGRGGLRLLPGFGRRRGDPVSACPKSAREGRYLLTCCRPEGHTGDCWCNNIREVDQ